MQNYSDIDELDEWWGGGKGEWLGVLTEFGKKLSQFSFSNEFTVLSLSSRPYKFFKIFSYLLTLL